MEPSHRLLCNISDSFGYIRQRVCLRMIVQMPSGHHTQYNQIDDEQQQANIDQ